MGQPDEPRILWTSYQRDHIENRHGITQRQFEEAWRDRDDLGDHWHETGPYTVSIGFTDDDRMIDMVWRWQDDDVWPITAYPSEEDEP